MMINNIPGFDFTLFAMLVAIFIFVTDEIAQTRKELKESRKKMLDPVFHPKDKIEEQRQRFYVIMRRHIRAEDSQLSDYEMIAEVWKRHLKDRGVALIDPNE